MEVESTPFIIWNTNSNIVRQSCHFENGIGKILDIFSNTFFYMIRSKRFHSKFVRNISRK